MWAGRASGPEPYSLRFKLCCRRVTSERAWTTERERIPGTLVGLKQGHFLTERPHWHTALGLRPAAQPIDHVRLIRSFKAMSARS